MNTPYFLNRDKLAEMDPEESNDHHRYYLSPSSTPTHVSFGTREGLGLCIKFDYTGKEPESSPEPLDSSSPVLMVVVGKLTHKLMEILSADLPIEGEAVILMASRIGQAVDSQRLVGRRLSYRLISKVLQDIGSRFDEEMAEEKKS